MRAPSRLRGRISLAVGVGAVLVAAGVALLLGNTLALRGSAESTNRADAYLLRLIDVERLVVDAETGLRGEVITGHPLFLQPLFRAQAQMPAAIASLQGAASQSTAYRPATMALIGAVRSYMSGYVPYLLRLARRDLSKARSFSVTLEGKHLVDGIRARVARLEQLLSTSQAARTRDAHQTANRSIVEAIVVLVLLTLLTFVLGGYLGHLVVDRERAREQTEKTAHTLQESVLPPVLPEIPSCELATRFIPGGGAVSGDFYDVLELEPGSWAVMIGDVCGKGSVAAAATAMARWTLRSSLTMDASPAEALRFLNQVVLQQSFDCRFITAMCLKLALEPDFAQVEIACAGHPAPVLVPSAGAPRALPAEGDLLGILPTIRLRTADVQLRTGDSLVAYTDGVTDQGPEARRSPQEALNERTDHASAEELAGILVDLAHRPAGRHPDDIAIVALRFVAENGESTSLAAAATAADGPAAAEGPA